MFTDVALVFVADKEILNFKQDILLPSMIVVFETSVRKWSLSSVKRYWNLITVLKTGGYSVANLTGPRYTGYVFKEESRRLL